MIKKIFCTLSVVTLLLCSLYACKSDSADPSYQKITLNEVAHSIFYAPQYVAVEKDYFKDEGIEIELMTGFGADKVMTSLLSGDTQIGFMGSEASVYTWQEGAEDQMVNFAQLTQRAGNFLVARKEMPNFKWTDLKGKNVIGGRKGGMPEMVFEYILKKNNLEPFKDVSIDQNIDFGSTGAAFSGGKGDFTVEFEPGATLLEGEGVGVVAASLGVDSGYVPYTAYCAKDSYIKSNRETIQHFTNALQKGMDFVSTHSSKEIAEVISPQFKETSPATIEKIVDRYKKQDTWKKDLIFQKESFDLLLDILDSAGELKKAAPYDRLVNTSFAEKAAGLP